MPTADFEIAYDGEALRTGTMDVRELAPALLAIGDLCQEANTLLNGDLATVAVKVKAVGRGSFDVNLLLDQLPTLTKAISLFPVDLKTAKELTWYLFGSQGAVLGLIGLIKLLKGKPIQSTQILKDGSTVIDFTNANLTNSQITVAPSVRRLYEDPPARRAAERIVKPLEREGIEVFRIKESGTLIEEVSRDEVEFFKTPETLLAAAENSENERIVTLQIVTASFEDRYQWRFTDGNMTLTARIEDPLFFERIGRGERFGKGDILRVQLHQRQWRDEKGLHAEYRIFKSAGGHSRSAADETFVIPIRARIDRSPGPNPPRHFPGIRRDAKRTTYPSLPRNNPPVYKRKSPQVPIECPPYRP